MTTRPCSVPGDRVATEPTRDGDRMVRPARPRPRRRSVLEVSTAFVDSTRDRASLGRGDCQPQSPGSSDHAQSRPTQRPTLTQRDGRAFSQVTASPVASVLVTVSSTRGPCPLPGVSQIGPV